MCPERLKNCAVKVDDEPGSRSIVDSELQNHIVSCRLVPGVRKISRSDRFLFLEMIVTELVIVLTVFFHTVQFRGIQKLVGNAIQNTCF